MSAFDPDIARQPAEPSGAEPAPKREPKEDNYGSKNDQHFSDFRHPIVNLALDRGSGNRRLPRSATGRHPQMMSLGQLSEAALYTRDLAAAQHFYHQVLGLEIISTMEDRGIAFRCGATVLLIFDPARTRIPDAGVPTHGGTGEGHIAFTIEESEIDSWRMRLREFGVAIEVEVPWPSGGRSIYFRDPAGNVVELAPPTLWRLKDQNS